MARRVHSGHAMAHTTAARLTHTVPQLRLIAAMPDNPNDERRDTPTDLAPPPSEPQGERPTQPPDPIAEAGALKAVSTMLPAAPTAPSAPSPAPPEYWKSAYDKLCEIHEEQKHDRAARQERDDTLVVRVSDAIATRLEPRFGAIEDKDKAQDARLSAVTEQLSKLTERISEIEKAQAAGAFHDELRDIKSSVLSLIDAVSTMGTNKTELAGRKVLLVDDHDLILKSLSRVISSYGAHVITASTLAAVKALIADVDPDCVLVDVRLAAGENGADVARWLLESGVDKSRVLLMSGDTGPVPTAVAEQIGVRLVAKPMTSAELVSVIREASNRKN